MEKFLKNRYMIIVHILLMCVAMNLYRYIPIEGLYYTLIAFSWSLISLFFLWCFGDTKAGSVLIVWSMFCLNNLFDELFFNPTEIQINEYVFAFLTIILLCKKKKSQEKSGKP